MPNFKKLNVSSQKGSIPILFLFASLGLLLFIFITNTFNFKDKTFSALYPKPFSYAAGSGFTISGFVLNGTSGFQGAAVTLDDVTNYKPIPLAFTSSSGSYSFSNVNSGDTYKVSITQPGFIVTSQKQITLANLSANAINQNFTITPNIYSTFPSISMRMFSLQGINKNAGFLQAADYDTARHRIIYYPWGNTSPPASTPSGILVTYNTPDTANTFTNSGSWHAYDMTQLADPQAWGRGGGFLDSSDTYAYMPPFDGLNATDNLITNTVFIRVNLAKDLSTKAAYEAFNTNSLPTPPPNSGWVWGAFGNNAAYFTPGKNTSSPLNPQTIFIKFDASLGTTFNNPSAWTWFDLRSLKINSDCYSSTKGFTLYGYQGAMYSAPYIYLIPSVTQTIIRYDTTKPFGQASSYDCFDLSTMIANGGNFIGSNMIGKYLLMIPYMIISNKSRYTTAVLYDTTKPLTNASSYQTFDVSSVDPIASGYQGAWLDNNNYLWLIPDGNDANGTNGVRFPPFLAWNTSLPFTNPTSWTAYPSVSQTGQFLWPSTGAGFDAISNTAYPAPWSTSLTQIQITSPVPTTTPTPVPIVTPTPIPTTINDNTPPTISITAPLPASIITRNSSRTITATASDNVGVTKVYFLVNGSLTCTDTVAPYSCIWNLSGKPNALYTIQATASDAAGNTGTSTVTVTSSLQLPQLQ